MFILVYDWTQAEKAGTAVEVFETEAAAKQYWHDMAYWRETIEEYFGIVCTHARIHTLSDMAIALPDIGVTHL